MMDKSVYIYRETEDWFTLFGEGKRLEVDGYLPEDQAIRLFSDAVKIKESIVRDVATATTGIVFEGIDSLMYGPKVIPLKEAFEPAIRFLLQEANRQELVFGYYPIIHEGQAQGAYHDFARFFYTMLKGTRTKPEGYVFPEFSFPDPTSPLVDSVHIGGGETREKGFIRDKEQLETLEKLIHERIEKELGEEKPEAIWADNYFIRSCYADRS